MNDGLTGIAPEAMKLFMDYDWPGNVRELKSVLEYAFVVAEKGLINKGHLPPGMSENLRIDNKSDQYEFFEKSDNEPSEKTDLIKALKKTDGNQSQTAKILGISRVTVWNRMNKYGIDLKKQMVI